MINPNPYRSMHMLLRFGLAKANVLNPKQKYSATFSFKSYNFKSYKKI
jgi:hypothetical protein